jgi:hypothetical protein
MIDYWLVAPLIGIEHDPGLSRIWQLDQRLTD